MSTSPIRICLLADSHDLYDDRIYWKQAVSLKKLGYEVIFILAGDQFEEGVTAEGIHYTIHKRDSFPSNRYLNYLAKRLPGNLYTKLYKSAAAARADVYHIHDLKVNRIGNKLLRLDPKPKLLYDVHEPYPENILDYWKDNALLRLIRIPWAHYVKRWERRKVRRYDLIITTEENMQNRFKSYFPDKPVEIIYNYTNLKSDPEQLPFEEKAFDLIYTGGITRIRGAMEILEAAKNLSGEMPDIKILFVGSWFPAQLKTEMEQFVSVNKLQNNVILKDAVPYTHIAELYAKSKIGLGIFLPARTHRIILQIKIFEYLYFGLPIIGSNFGHLHRIAKKYNCGITVQPDDPAKIAKAVISLLSDKKKYETLSRNGSEAARKYFTWERMENKLEKLYRELLNE